MESGRRQKIGPDIGITLIFGIFFCNYNQECPDWLYLGIFLQSQKSIRNIKQWVVTFLWENHIFVYKKYKLH